MVKNNNSFLRNLLITLSGVSFAQFVPVLATPFLAKLFSPQDFGEFSVFFGISSILGILYSVKLDAAIITATDNDQSFSILNLGIISCILFSIITFITVVFLSDVILDKVFSTIYYALLIPILAISTSIYYLFIAFLLRNKAFDKIAKARAVRAILILGLTLFIGYTFESVNGLIIGAIIGQLMSLAIVFRFFLALDLDRYSFFQLSAKQLYLVFDKHKRFPLFSAPAAVFNTFAAFLPVFFFKHLC